ncbi:pyroglutamyl-peptidase I [Natranaerobius trueperi]|uniref:Pyrrolidone-carboxylate peptidase n=1 Tax=Natranaerobius trueperi TaxID=759412 RepID=A0A226C0G3_9FIRM|nr:pyroglutamyl-peptidase I [Natranaerobius trueperi]OWZ84661.1 pyroglutamyl-peptidase I [Natranaerobius trueperi]
MKKVLLTGFDPFGEDSINPSWEAVKELPDKISNGTIKICQVPTVFDKSIEEVTKMIDKWDPDIIICIGQAGGRFDITIERVAINIDDARIADNEGKQPIDRTIKKDGEPAYFSNLPIKAMSKNIKDNGLPASVSNTAGTFVCNHIMYGVLHYIKQTNSTKKGGFIHVPFIPSQVVTKPNKPSMSLKDITDALYYAIEACIKNEDDIKTTEGKIF